MEKNQKDIQYAYELVEYSIDNYEKFQYMGILCVLNGAGFFRVGTDDKKGHNYRAAVDAMHMYQENNMDKSVMDIYELAMCRTIAGLSSAKAFDRVMSILYYELEKEKNNETSFVLNFDSIFVELDKLAERNGKKYFYGFNVKRRIEQLKNDVEVVRFNMNQNQRKGGR